MDGQMDGRMGNLLDYNSQPWMDGWMEFYSHKQH